MHEVSNRRISPGALELAKAVLDEGHHRLCITQTHPGHECDCYWSRKDVFILARAVVAAAEEEA